MKKSSAFTEGFTFEDDSVGLPLPVKQPIRATVMTAEGQEVDVPEMKRKKNQSIIDVMIGKLKAEKRQFYNEITADTAKYKEQADVLHEKNSKVKQKQLQSENTEDDFTTVHSKALMEGSAATFEDMQLSRALLKGITAARYVKPTPIQSTCVPLGLKGVDICACSATGTGKTAAYMLPILERLHFKPAGAAVTRVLVVLPTRELALQVFQVTKNLSQFTRIQVTLAAGGLDLKTQEDAVRRFPDILVATPGRLIDMLENTPSFHLSNIEILVLDEADRILDDSFEDQIKEIVKQCSTKKQTMFFSATMTDSVKELAMVSLKDPVKIFIDSSLEVAENLRQEFVRVRANHESEREAILVALLVRNFASRVIVFVQTKVLAKRLHIVLGLLGLVVGELHSNIPQILRMSTLRKFKAGMIDVLIATDLAARGLDIEGVRTVVNFTLPGVYKQYIHRVGRTARAGKSGVSVSLVGESERRMLKEILKYSKNKAKNRIVPPEVITYYVKLLAKLEPDMAKIDTMVEDDEELSKLETKLLNAEATMEEHELLYGDEKLSYEQLEHIRDRIADPTPRGWFETHKDRMRKKLENNLSRYAGEVNKRKRESGGGDEFEPTNKKKCPSKREIRIQKSVDRKKESEKRTQFEIKKAQLLAARDSKTTARKTERYLAVGDGVTIGPIVRDKKDKGPVRTGFDKDMSFDHSHEAKKRDKPRMR
jgi:ATP-dependent RNA helicase DDX27